MITTDNQVRMLYIDHNLMLGVVQGFLRVWDLGLPADADVRAVDYDFPRRAFALLIHSATFDPVPSGEIPPTLAPTGPTVERLP